MSHFFSKFSITQRLTLSFLVLIGVGSVLLSLPISHPLDAPPTHYTDHLFNVVSMVCVTGLSVIPVAQAYNHFGQLIAMILMETGGLGLVTLIAIASFMMRRQVNLSDQNLLQTALNRQDAKGLKTYLFRSYQITASIQGLAILLLMCDFIPRFGWKQGLFNSLFMAISAFCNAGFDNFGDHSLIDFANNPLINLTIATLIIFGGLGFSVWMELLDLAKKSFNEQPRRILAHWRKLTPQSQLVISSTGLLLLFGTTVTWFLEKDNPATLGPHPIWTQWLIAFFQTVTMRTAGFATISYLDTHPSTNLIFMIEMLIGGAPGGTAGGIKITTFALIFLLFRSEISGQSIVTYAHRRITNSLIKQTLTVIIFFMICLLGAYFLLLITEPHLSPTALIFEAVSAIATVGVSMDLTSHLSQGGRWIIMLLMFIGRVGPITVLLSMTKKGLGQKPIQYAPANFNVG